tara:strand:+ start:3601 stop:4599 length:999 start_codon:yes stop_codon:yes gene_type:complete
MVDVTETIVTNRQDPAIEAYRLGLLGDVQGYIKDQISSGVAPPDYQIAGLAPGEQAAIVAAQQGLGAYQPYLNAGMQSIGSAGGMISGANPTFQQGISSLAGTGAQYDPTSYESFMNPYEDAAVQSAMGDIQRSSDIAQQGNRAQAVGAGAFGGSRDALVQAELQRNTMDQQARTAAQMRAAGYGQAQQLGMGAFDSAMGRQQQAAQTYGQLGQGIGGLGQQLGQIGVQQAGLGEMRAALGTQDVQNLMATGASERGIQQAGLDATRLSNLQRYSQPYQQYGFLSDIYSGTPTGSSTLTAASAPQVSPFQSALGLGIAGLSAASGASRAGLF